MQQLLVSFFLILGSFFTLVAALGVLRMPDILTRMHSSTKAGTLGTGLIFLAVALHFYNLDTSIRMLAAASFISLTAPVGSHLIGRSAYFLGIKLWEGTIVDQLRDNPKVKK